MCNEQTFGIESRRDIAYLDLYYDDGSSDQFYLPWEDDQDECHNKRLTTQYNENGNLSIFLQI